MSNGNGTTPTPNIEPGTFAQWDGRQWIYQPFWPGSLCGPGGGDMLCPPPGSCWPVLGGCWDLSQEAIDAITKILKSILQNNPGLIPPSTVVGPIVGVTDGSDAGPGEVGEFVTTDGFTNYAAYPAATVGNISLIVMQPGDWDMWISAIFTTDVGGAFFQLPAPLPVGVSNSMVGYTALAASVGSQAGGTGVEGVVVIGQYARGSFAVPTLLAFVTRVDQSSNNTLPAGTMQLHFEARRRR